MKRIIATFIFMICVYMLASAPIVIEAEGTGKDLNEAKQNARINLAEKIFPGIVQSETTVSFTDDSKSLSSNYTSKSSYTIVGEFPGFDYEIVSSKKNNYVVKTRIAGNESTLNFYSNKLEEEGSSAIVLYNQYLSLSSSVSVTKRKESLQTVLSCYSLYEMYSNIIIKLGGTVPDEDILPKTYTVLSYELESLINEEENELLKKSSSESISQEITQKLAELATVRAENKKAIEEASEQAREQRALKLQQTIAEYTLTHSSDSVSLTTSASLEVESYNEYLRAIETAQKDLSEITDLYENLIEEQTSAIEKSFNEESDAIRNRTYPSAHLDLNGNPTADAKKLRENEIRKLRKEKDAEKDEIIEAIDLTVRAEIQKRYNYFTALIETFSEKEFYIYSSRGESSISARYDGSSYSWNLTLQMEEPYSFEFNNLKLSYEALTGITIPSDEDERLSFIGSEEYTETVDAYNKMFSTGKYESVIIFSAEVNASGNVSATYKSLKIEFADGTEIKIELDRTMTAAALSFCNSNYMSYVKLDEDGPTVGQSVEPDTKEKEEHSLCHFEADIRLGGSIGRLWNENINGSVDLILEGKLFVSDFFVSVSGDISLWFVSNLGNRKTLFGTGFYGGIGYRIKDFAAVTVRTSYARNLGLIFNPFVSVVFSKTSNFRFEVYGGCYINCKNGRTAGSFGVESSYSWR